MRFGKLVFAVFAHSVTIVVKLSLGTSAIPSLSLLAHRHWISSALLGEDSKMDKYKYSKAGKTLEEIVEIVPVGSISPFDEDGELTADAEDEDAENQVNTELAWASIKEAERQGF